VLIYFMILQSTALLSHVGFVSLFFNFNFNFKIGFVSLRR